MFNDSNNQSESAITGDTSMFDWLTWEWANDIYWLGFSYSIIFFLALTMIFAFVRWGISVQRYIKTGDIGDQDETWFFVKNNWFHGDEAPYNYGTQPFVVAADIFFMGMASLGLSLVWPISVITVIVITYAKAARARFVHKQTFIANLKGEEPQIHG